MKKEKEEKNYQLVENPDKKKVFSIHELKKKVMETEPKGSGGFISTHQLKDGKLPPLSDREFVVKNIEELSHSDIQKMKKKIEEKIAQRPKCTYWKCTNTKTCGWKGRGLWNDKPGACMFCNWQNWEGGGQLVEMSKDEAEQFVKDEQARFKAARERALKAGLYHVNEGRLKQGLEPLTMAEYLKEQQRLNDIERSFKR